MRPAHVFGIAAKRILVCARSLEKSTKSGLMLSSNWTLALFEAIDDAVFVHDDQGNILEANPAATRRLGYSREELLSLNTRDIDDSEFAAGFQNRLRSQLQNGVMRCEGVHRTQDGRRIHVEISSAAIQMKGTAAVLAIVRDITEHKRVEADLLDSRALYESLVEGLPQSIFRKDRQSRLTFGNQRYCADLGRSLPELLGKTDFDFFSREMARKYIDDDQRVMETRQNLDTIEEHHRPDGSKLFVHVVKAPIRNADDEVIGVQGIFWDVTEEVFAHRKIARSERRYRQFTEAAMDGIVVIDQHGDIVVFNPAAERMFGYGAGEVLGASARVLVPDEFKELHAQGVAKFLATRMQELLGQPQEVRGKRKDGSDFPAEVSLSLLTDPGEANNQLDQPSVQILAAIRDLTDRNKMRAVLVQNEKLASIGLLSAGVAHEINNPLAFVANNLVVLERDCKGLLDLLELHERAQGALALDAELAVRIEKVAEEIDLPYVKANMARILSRTRDGIDRVTRIVHSLRGMARTDTPHRQDTHLPDIITNCLEILHGKFKHLGIVIDQQHDPRLMVPCVPTQTSQVVLNLLVNAFQAIEAFGRADGRVGIRTARHADELLLEIRDNGGGIKQEHLNRLFDPFFTTKDVGEGTGLGLSISHHIIAAHGGRIEVDTKPGDGSCFRLYLPLRDIRSSHAAEEKGKS
jgi:PAS domain S-box-containing protein